MKKKTGYDHIAASIKNFRISKGLTLSELSGILDTSQSYISEIENAVTKPGFNFLLNLRKEFKVDINALLDSTIEDVNDIASKIQFQIHLETKAFTDIVNICNESLKKLSAQKPLTLWQKILKAIKQFSNKTI